MARRPRRRRPPAPQRLPAQQPVRGVGIGTDVVEKTKLTAALLNAIASGTIIVAIIVPYIGLGIGTIAPTAKLGDIMGLSARGFVIGVIIHLIARRLLDALKETENG